MVRTFEILNIKIKHIVKLSNSNNTDKSDSDLSIASFQSEKHNMNLENVPYIILFRHIRRCTHKLSLCVNDCF